MTTQTIHWFRRMPTGGTAYRRGGAVNAIDELAAKEQQYRKDPCCAVPLVLPNPDCDRHAYRGLVVDLARALDRSGTTDALCARVLRLETDAMVRVLKWFRETTLATAAQEVAKGYAAEEVHVKVMDHLQQLIASLEG